MASRTKRLLFKEDLPLKSSPMVILSSVGTGAIGEGDYRSGRMSQFTAVVVDWLLEDKIKRLHKSPDKRLYDIKKVLRSRLLDNLGPLQEPAQLNDVDVLSRLIEATRDISPGIVVSAKPFESIYSKTSGKLSIGKSVNLDVKSTLVTVSRDDLNALIEKQISQFYSELLSGRKGESFSIALRIIENLNRVQIREDVLRILEKDFVVAFMHDYKEYVDPWIQKYYRNLDFNKYVKDNTENTGSSSEPVYVIRGMLDQLIALSNMDEAQKFEYFKKLKDTKQISCLFSSFHEVKLFENKKISTGEFERLIKQYEKCLERAKQEKGKSVGSKVDYLQAKTEV